MSNDTTASLQAQAQEVYTAKGSRALALFLIGKSVYNNMGLTLADCGDSLHLMEAADELQALIEGNTKSKVTKPMLKDYMEEADRLAQPYMEEAKEELEFLRKAFLEETSEDSSHG